MDIAVIILTWNEQLHIARCLERIAPLHPSQIFIVDSPSTDETQQIARNTAKRLGWTHAANSTQFEIVVHKWPGLYAEQFNWALRTLPISARWVLRLDADEYFLPEAIEEITEKLPHLPNTVTGIINKRRHYFCGTWVKRGTYPVMLLRIFRHGSAMCEERYMDEHIQVLQGESVNFEEDFVDHNLNPLSWWISKHRGYAKREAMDAIEIISHQSERMVNEIRLVGQARNKRENKYRYYRLPPYVRVYAYWLVKRYIIPAAFLEGKGAFVWNLLQGYWYRFICDVEICSKLQYPIITDWLLRVVSVTLLVITLIIFAPVILMFFAFPVKTSNGEGDL